MERLSELSITYIDSISFKGSNLIKLDVLSLGEVVTVTLDGVINFTLSNNDLDNEDTEGFAVVDVLHEYRSLNDTDLSSYDYGTEVFHDKKFNILLFEGDAVIKILCKTVEIE